MTTPRTYRRRIRRAYESASPEAIELGRDWYPSAQAIVRAAADAGDTSAERAAVAMAHLSPRCSWAQNVRALLALVNGEDRPAGTMAGPWARAQSALTAEDPWATFGPRAHKTRNFARNLLGDPDAVTVDTWVARVVGETEHGIRSRYGAIADAYRAEARRAGMAPRDLQAITWVAARNGRAA